MIYTASSQYKDFGPARLKDGKGWLSQVNDLNAWINVEFGKSVETIEIVNGFYEFPDESDWKWHARAAVVRLRNSGEMLLADTLAPQTIALPGKMDAVWLEIVSVYPSEKFNVVGLMRLVPK